MPPHCIGYAPAQLAEMMYFSRIDTYIDMRQSLAGEQSRFQAEAARIDDIGKCVERFDNNHILVLMDEPLLGIYPQTAQNLVSELARRLGHEATVILSS